MRKNEGENEEGKGYTSDDYLVCTMIALPLCFYLKFVLVGTNAEFQCRAGYIAGSKLTLL